jgi:hypothetical protein
MSERASFRPVTLARLVELTNACSDRAQTTEELEVALDVSHRRARETILEACRIGLLDEDERDTEEDTAYSTTTVGNEFLEAVRAENWHQVSRILQAQSPHYEAFLVVVDEVGPAVPGVT